ncbi:MAG: NAD-glutamate dehydrogenase [Gammaproteobacteria bacterium]|nr:NAD-glutamate dehydrogenase [Gammaproteobacteria bacterium]
MSLPPAERTTEIIDKLVVGSRRKLPKAEAPQIEQFLRQYYHRVSPEDLEERSLLDLAGAALAHWHLARERRSGDAKLHVYNPHFEKHGWQSTHTIVEVVVDDMPFLVDSVSMALNRLGLTIHLTVHPVVCVRRDDAGNLTHILPRDGTHCEAITESFMHFQVDRQTEQQRLEDIRNEIQEILTDVSMANSDWQSMRRKVVEAVTELEENPPPLDTEDVAEATAFCRWIEAHHFTFLGYIEFDIIEADGGRSLKVLPDSRLGILRDVEDECTVLPTSPDEYSALHELLVVTKANSRATVHRPAYMDFIGIKRYAPDGRPVGERIILGLFTSAAYFRNTRDIPLLRHKVMRVMSRSGLPISGHAGKALQNIFETYPRDSLFQISEDKLFTNAMGILELQERQRIRLLVRRDLYGRFYSLLVFVPRERYTRELRLRIQGILMDAYGGSACEFNTLFSESVLARIQYLIYTHRGSAPKYDEEEVQARITEAARSWADNLRDALYEQYGEERGNYLFGRYGDAFPVSYMHDFWARSAAFDTDRVEHTRESGRLGITFYRPLVETQGGVRLKLFAAGRPVSPSDALPVIENMGLKVVGERPYEIHPRDSDPVWIHEFHLVHAENHPIDPDEIGEQFQNTFLRVWSGEVENDGFNRLVIEAGLAWRETVVLRAYCRYLRQIRVRYSETYMIESLVANPRITRLLVDLFETRFNPGTAQDRDARAEQLIAQIDKRLDDVANLDEDRILRSFGNLIRSTVRTNYFQSDPQGEPKPYVSFKFDSSTIARMPEPRPLFEIFLYSPRTEAVHLRGGRVARGGLRWSDRREDFRTEVLGLVKAQMVKNAVIVPMGAKGGFVVKRPPVERDALHQEAVECYKTFLCGMLDVTDNLIAGKLVAPRDVVRHDDDDPYLVVAADKGTASFSDIANSVSAQYSFWLGDAFASGGSIGYDHKKMGITAKGAWESVKRHFRELGIDTQTTDFTVVGIGDMSGDVFGNGMLLSRHIRLVAAFNHLHIFLDPEPDPEKSYRERERLFNLPRSSWADYDAQLISEGGGVYSRRSKSITLSSQVQIALRVKAERMTPNELINAILKAPVDLIWNGGIGTYVKSQTETHEQVSDRANEVLRVDGRELRCRVFGEGGNLGVTQLGRIEYSRNGGLCYTDSIDNSAGVDTSDHEVNIKIFLDSVVANGDMTAKQRNRLLAEMTDEVAQLVLSDNYGQTQAISIAASQAQALLQQHGRFMRHLERNGHLNRRLEFLPDDDGLADRLAANEGLTRPEISILLCYAKMTLYQQLLDSDVPEDPFLRHELEHYFPDRLAARFKTQMYEHRLKREIIATHITNSMVNVAGLSFAFRLSEVSGMDPPSVARAYAGARQIFGMRELWHQIEALDNRVAARTQTRMLLDAVGLIERATLWLLRNREAPLDIAETVEFFEEGVGALAASLPRPLAAENRLRLKRRTKELVSQGVPAELAVRVAGLIPLSSALDIVDVARAAAREVGLVASVYFALGAKLELLWLRDQVANLPTQSHWHLLAKSSLRSDFHHQQRRLTAAALTAGRGGQAKSFVNAWVDENRPGYDRYKLLMGELRSSSGFDYAMLSVALSELQTLSRASAPSLPASEAAA